MPRVVGKFESVNHAMMYGTEFKVVNLSHTEIANLTHKYLNTSID